MKDEFYYGGQAVIEGVMMRGKKSLAVAVRRPSGEIEVRRDPLKSIADRFPVLKLPLLRGTVALIEAMVIGVKTLSWSASKFAEEEDEEELGAKEIVLTMGFALLLTIGLFVVLPAFLVKLLQGHISNNIVLNVIEGLIKVSFFLIYVGAISFMKDIQRVFQYHGAEHKTINCYEAGEPLTVDNVRRHTKIHKRCGTSFIVFVLITSIFIFSFFGRPPFLERILIHLAILPLVAGVSYEIIRQAGKDNPSRFIQWLSRPGMWTQLLTTREPDDEQIDVAIRSLETVLVMDGVAETTVEDPVEAANAEHQPAV